MYVYKASVETLLEILSRHRTVRRRTRIKPVTLVKTRAKMGCYRSVSVSTIARIGKTGKIVDSNRMTSRFRM